MYGRERKTWATLQQRRNPLENIEFLRLVNRSDLNGGSKRLDRKARVRNFTRDLRARAANLLTNGEP